MSRRRISRRIFLMGASAAVAGSAVLRGRTRRVSALSKLNIAAIGSGGKGREDTHGCKGENIVALCDVDWERAAQTFSEFPNAKKYVDFREMLDKEDIDAVTITTPDHFHAVAAVHAMKMGKHVYVQKPLTYTIAEARLLTKVARETGVATQMGNQGHSGDGVRQLCEMIWNGDIGQVREAHIWTNRPVWPQGLTRPPGSDPIPDTLDWDLWIGPAPKRPFVAVHPDLPNKRGGCYCPFVWRGWQDFGCGSLGDMACHIADPANWSLLLHTTGPTSVEAVQNVGMTDDSYPTKSVIRYEFPRRGEMDPVTVYWYDGGIKPPTPEGLPEGTVLGDGDNGSLFIGTEGIATTGEYGGNTRLLPDTLMNDYSFPDQTIPRIPEQNPYHNWIQACKGGAAACSNFDYAGPFTEWVALGNLALRFDEKLEWDAKAMKVTNVREANQYVTREYHNGWDLGI